MSKVIESCPLLEANNTVRQEEMARVAAAWGNGRAISRSDKDTRVLTTREIEISGVNYKILINRRLFSRAISSSSRPVTTPIERRRIYAGAASNRALSRLIASGEKEKLAELASSTVFIVRRHFSHVMAQITHPACHSHTVDEIHEDNRFNAIICRRGQPV